MKRVGKCCLPLLTVLMFSGMASASTLVVNCGTVSGPTELNTSILCPQFNSIGTLSSISIAVSGGVSGSITLTNGSASPQTGSGTTTISFNFGSLGGFSFVNPIYSPSFTTGTQSLAAGQTLTVSGLSALGNGTLGSDTTVFVPYIGAGNFSIPISTSTFFLGGGTGGFFMAAQASTANATAVVTYTYDVAPSVPEPTTITLLGLGLLGIGVMSRKVKKQEG